MPYTMTHLLIADNYIKKHNFSKDEEALFLLASNAPDAVHAIANYNPHMKECSHIVMSGFKWGTVIDEEPMKLWYQNIKKFYNDNISKGLNHLDLAFLQGYTLHIFTDIFNSKYLYGPSCKRIGQGIEKFRIENRNENLICDSYLYLHSENSKELINKIKDGIKILNENPIILEHLGLEKFISCDNISHNILNNIMEYQKCKSVNTDGLNIINPNMSYEFIEKVSSHADKFLFEFLVEDGMFKVKC